MRILHYLPEQKENDLLTNYVETLCNAMQDMAETTIVTDKTMRSLTSGTTFDIIHVHSCWHLHAAQFINRMADKGMPVVLSPHGNLDTFTMQNEQHLTKQGKRFLYQQKAVQRAEALLATSNRELEALLKLGWNRRIGVVKSSLFDSTVPPRKMAEETLRLYRKVIDTRYRILMTPSEERALCILLHTGTARDAYEQAVSAEQQQMMETLTETQWRRMLLYADDEGVRNTIDKAIDTHRIPAPSITTSQIERFPSAHPKSLQPLVSTLPKGKANRLLATDAPTLHSLCAMLLDAKAHWKASTLSMKHVCMLFEAFRYEDFDEDRFSEVIRQLGAKTFTSHILSVLNAIFSLGEGFMPIPPKDGNTARDIRQLLFH